jgi:beta-lactamase class D
VRKIIRLSAIAIVFVVSSSATGQTTSPQSNSVADVFLSRGIVATFVVASSNSDVTHVYNEARSIERFSPASTFKIPNTLIALDTHVVDSKDTVFKWDGSDKGLPQWNSDQTLETALRVSCVWCYQEIAREVGSEKYESVLAQLSYGNHSAGRHVDLFWLNGNLLISADEQIGFLQKLYNYELPFRNKHVDVLKDIMLVEKNAEYSLYAKTGWAITTPQVAWYVGFIETGSQTWFFAMNMQVDRKEQVSLRKELAIASLQALGII